jgi:hypothetical protein
MVQTSLTEYINKLLKSGYDVGTIRTTLINAGYPLNEINQALTYAKKAQPGKKTLSLNLKLLLIGISVIILIILLVLGGIKLLTPKPKNIDFRVTAIKTEAFPGDSISFLSELTSDTDRKEQVLLNYEILNTRTDELAATKQERKQIGKKSSTTVQITIPTGTEPGGYTLTAVMSYKVKTETQSFRLTVLEPPEENETIPIDESFEEEILEEEVECPKTCDDFNPCTNDYCEKGLCKHTQIVPCCGNGVCEEGESILDCADDCAKQKQTPQEILLQAKKVAAVDPEAAAMLCNKLIRPNDVDLCFSEVAQTSSRSVICENIQTSEDRDGCYMNFALDGDYAVCAKVKNSYLSKSCNSLKRSSTMLAQAEDLAKEFNATSPA